MLAGDNEQDPDFQRMMKTHKKHTEHWGYRLEVLSRFIVGDGGWSESIFSKPLFVTQLLAAELGKPESERAEWIVWFDADTIILNPHVSWEIFLPPEDFPDIHMIGSRDWNGYNCGVFFLRVNEWSVKLFSQVAAFPLLNPEVDNGPNPDQTVLENMLKKPEIKKHYLHQSINWHNGFHRSFGNLRDVRPGDLLVHFAGVKWDGGHEILMNAIRGWLDKVDKEPEAWALPMNETKYSAEIEDYWSHMRVARDLDSKASAALNESATYIQSTDAKCLYSQKFQNTLLDLDMAHKELRSVVAKEPFHISKMESAGSNLSKALDSFRKLDTDEKIVIT